MVVPNCAAFFFLAVIFDVTNCQEKLNIEGDECNPVKRAALPLDDITILSLGADKDA